MNEVAKIRPPDFVVFFCITEYEAHRAIDEIVADAGGRIDRP
jgi:hypothetical protein